MDATKIVADWQAFYALSGAACATLIGLLFVSVSLHLETFVAHQNLRAVAVHMFSNYLSVLLASLIFLIPSQTTQGIAIPMAVIGVYGASRMVIQVVRSLRRGNRQDIVLQGSLLWTIVTFFFYALIAIVALVILIVPANLKEALPWLMVGIIFLLAQATIVAWSLMLWVAQIRYSQNKS